MSPNSAVDIQSLIDIFIEGNDEEVLYSDLHIDQELNAHHKFSFLWRLDLDKVNDLQQQEDLAREFLGKTVGMNLGDNYFKALITTIEVAAKDQMSKGLVISGVSPTILIDEVVHNQIYEETDFSGFVQEAMHDIPQNLLKASVDSNHTDSIPFTIQYNETDFQFLQRMCKRWGEFMYYDGERLVLGPPQDKGHSLRNGYDLLHFGISSSLKSSHLKFVTYDPIAGESNNDEIDDPTAPGGDQDLSAITDTSTKTFRQNGSKMVHLGEQSEQAVIDEIKKLREQAYIAGLILFKGQSNNTNLSPGEIVNIDKGSISANYIITQVSHYSGIQGRYENTFEAIPATVEVPPYTDPQINIPCESQSATVYDNKDPEGLGRVRVTFCWNKSIATPWLRVISPHGGSDKGFYFVPELKEEVLVSFEGGNAERPYVTGSFYNGKANPESWTSENNDIKAIRTRSGHTIEFNDKKGEEELHIYGKDRCNVIILSTKDEKIQIISKGDIELQGKNVSIHAEDDLSLEAGSKSISLKAEKDIALESGKNVMVKAGKDLKTEGQKVDIAAQKKIKIDGKAGVNIDSPKTIVQGKVSKMQVV